MKQALLAGANVPCKHARTGPVMALCCQHLAITGPVLAHNGMLTTCVSATVMYIVASSEHRTIARLVYTYILYTERERELRGTSASVKLSLGIRYFEKETNKH